MQQAVCDTSRRDALIDKFMHLPRMTASYFIAHDVPQKEIDDMVGDGMVGLIRAAERFDPSRQIKFETFAIVMIRGAILEGLRNADWTPRQVRDRQGEIDRASARLELLHARDVTDEEVAEALGITLEALDGRRRDIAHARVASLNASPTESQYGECNFQDRLRDTSPGPDDITEENERLDFLATAISRLPDREQQVVALYYHGYKTFKAIGVALGISESRAYQLHQQALTRLRKDSRLRDLFE